MKIKEIIDEHKLLVEQFYKISPQIDSFVQICLHTIIKGNTLFFIGNGGSAADCQHLAAEFVGRFKLDRMAIPACALTTDTSILTAIGNDFSFEDVYVRQIKALIKPNDVLIAISTSGNSKNIIRGISAAKGNLATVVGLSGEDGGNMASLCDLCIKVPSKNPARIQEVHILIGHIICELVEQELVKIIGNTSDNQLANEKSI